MSYNKMYGKAELIREFNQFINSQRAIIENITTRKEVDRDE